MASFAPRVLPRRIPSPSGSDPNPPQAVAGIFFGEASKTPITSRIDERLNSVGHLEELAKKHTLNTLDPCVLDDNAVFLLEVDAKELDTRGGFNKLANLFHRDVDDKELDLRGAFTK